VTGHWGVGEMFRPGLIVVCVSGQDGRGRRPFMHLEGLARAPRPLCIIIAMKRSLYLALRPASSFTLVLSFC
jgi:hypothetical protein